MEEKKLYNAVQKFITLADGREIMIETGKLAKQADGSVVVKQGDTMLLATVVAAKDAKPDTDFMPLQVEYKEKYAACGRYPGGFMKREGKANDSEVLVARLIDRALRPLFPSDYHAEVYVTVNLISADKDIQPDALAGLAASAALAVSDIPFGGPISEVRVVRRNGEYAINPTYSEMPECDLDIMVGGTIDNILMVEGEMKEVSEEVMLGAIKFAHEEIKKHCAVQIELSKELGKDVKRTYCHEVNDEELRQTIIRELYDKAYAIATSGTMKHEREDMFNALEAEFAARYTEEELVERTHAVAAEMPVIGFYLQTACGGRRLSYEYWKAVADTPGVVAIKCASFNRYQSIDLVRGVAYSARREEIALYTGNDDNIVADLLTPYRFPVDGKEVELRFVGGLLGHWSVWTHSVVKLYEELREYRDGRDIPAELLARGAAVTDCNGVFFDVAHNFAGCIPGVHEVLRRQGLMAGTWCLDPDETLSEGQEQEISRVYEMYPHLNDDAFVALNLKDWMA